MFRFLGTPKEDKRRMLYDALNNIPQEEKKHSTGWTDIGGR
jgi:hypothetical protein